jgi:hypothetical protein
MFRQIGGCNPTVGLKPSSRAGRDSRFDFSDPRERDFRGPNPSQAERMRRVARLLACPELGRAMSGWPLPRGAFIVAAAWTWFAHSF